MIFFQLHSANGTKTESAKMLQEVVKDFAISHPDFIGLKAIYTIYRNFSKDQIQQKVKEFTQMQKSYPKLLIGFDFVGQEEIVSLLDIKNTINKFPKGIKLFLHAGETSKSTIKLLFYGLFYYYISFNILRLVGNSG